jgi:hypothetical protein
MPVEFCGGWSRSILSSSLFKDRESWLEKAFFEPGSNELLRKAVQILKDASPSRLCICIGVSLKNLSTLALSSRLRVNYSRKLKGDHHES